MHQDQSVRQEHVVVLLRLLLQDGVHVLLRDGAAHKERTAGEHQGFLPVDRRRDDLNVRELQVLQKACAVVSPRSFRQFQGGKAIDNLRLEGRDLVGGDVFASDAKDLVDLYFGGGLRVDAFTQDRDTVPV